MLFTLLVSAVIAAASSVAPASAVVAADDSAWIGVSCNQGTENAWLEVYRSADFNDWGGPVLKVSREGMAVIGGQLYQAPDGSLHLYYTLSKGTYDGEGIIYRRVCSDPSGAPAIWDEPVRVGLGCVSASPVSAPDGTLYLPAALWGPRCIDERFSDAHPELDARRGSLIYRSTDGGITWTAGATLNVPERLFAHYNNPRIFVSADGTINMVSRSCDSGFLYQAQSSDKGATWSFPRKFVQNTHAEFALSRLNDGRLILVKNFKIDARQFYGERELYAFLSEDEGRSWYGGLRLSGEPFVGQPVVFQRKDGEIFIACRKHEKDTSEVRLYRTTIEEIDASCPHKSKNIKSETERIFSAGRAAGVFATDYAAYIEKKKNPCPHTLRIGTYNIMRQGWGAGPEWKDRRESVIAEIEEHRWDILGTQEAPESYMKEIIKGASIKYGYIGNLKAYIPKEQYRGFSENVVLYRKDRFEVLDHGVLDYRVNKDVLVGANTNPDSYGTDFFKCTFWVKFRDRLNGVDFYCFNIHYPVRTPCARDAYSLVLLEYIHKNCEGLPVVITGDFNCTEDVYAYRCLHDSVILDDTMLALPEEQRKNWIYFSVDGFRRKEEIRKWRIHYDHIFYTPSYMDVLDWELDIDTVHDGKFASDHLPVSVELKFYK